MENLSWFENIKLISNLDVQENQNYNYESTWQCHLHRQEKCKILYDKNSESFHHVVPIALIDNDINKLFNSRMSESEFSEKLCSSNDRLHVTGLYYTNMLNKKDCFYGLLNILKSLDNLNVRYSDHTSSKSNKVTSIQVESLLKKHLITDGINRITLCNRHFLVKNKSKFKYSSPEFIKMLLLTMFPKASNKNKNIPIDTPNWVIEYISSLKPKIRFNKKKQSNNNLL